MMLKSIIERSVIHPTAVAAVSNGDSLVLPKNSGKANGMIAIPRRKSTTPVISSGKILRKNQVNRLIIISRVPEIISIPERRGIPPAPAARTDAGRYDEFGIIGIGNPVPNFLDERRSVVRPHPISVRLIRFAVMLAVPATAALMITGYVIYTAIAKKC